MRHAANVGTMLGQRRGRWANTGATLTEGLMFAGITIIIAAPYALWGNS